MIEWKGSSKTIENKTKEQKGRFLGILLGNVCIRS